MGIKIKNLQTGEFEKFNIPALKGEKGEPGEIESSEKVDYIGKQHSKLRDTMNANVDYIIKTAIGEFNYLDYEGQHISATNSIEGHARNAILKGCTLVNLCEGYTPHARASSEMWYNNNGQYRSYMTSKIKSNTIYTIIIEHLGDRLSVSQSNTYVENGKFPLNGILKEQEDNPIDTKRVFTVQTLDEANYLFVTTFQNGSGIDSNVVIIEGDYTDVDIPYFTGMQSVKMPVLTTTGKNLFDKSKIKKGYAISSSNPTTESAYAVRDYMDYIEVESGATYKLSNCTTTAIFGYKNKGDYYGYVSLNGINAIPHDVKYIRFNIDNSFDYSNAQLEKNTVATSYEPYKTNILTVNEDVTLRGIGDVQDTLDCLTGEVVENTIKLTFSGIENWETSTNLTNYMTFRLAKPSNMITADSHSSASKYVCDKLQIVSSNTVGSTEIEAIWFSSGHMYIRLPKTKASSLEEFKTYLSTNNIQVVSCAKQPVVKTVDLSDNHVYSYKDTTHYACSSEEGSLVPTLSVKVPTDTQLTIQEQKATTQTLLIKNMDLQQSIKEVQAMNLAFNTALYNSFNSIREEVEDIKKHVSTNKNLEGSF